MGLHWEASRILRYDVTCAINLSGIVIGFVTVLHGLTPRLGVWVMNVSCGGCALYRISDTRPVIGLEPFQDIHPHLRRRYWLGCPGWQHPGQGSSCEFPERVRWQLPQQQ